jgi:hypothetical protein
MGMMIDHFSTDEKKQRRKKHVDDNNHLLTIQTPWTESGALSPSSLSCVIEYLSQSLNEMNRVS